MVGLEAPFCGFSEVSFVLFVCMSFDLLVKVKVNGRKLWNFEMFYFNWFGNQRCNQVYDKLVRLMKSEGEWDG